MPTCLYAPNCTFIVVTFISALILLVTVSDACFIRNCPKGGKRSVEPTTLPARKCMRCGPAGLGQCVGPSVCCSPHFGCHFNTQEAEVCQQENQSTAPCSVTGDVCGAQDSGNCVADGVCCDSESCAMNERCRRKGKPSTVPRSDILQLIQRLLYVKDYD